LTYHFLPNFLEQMCYEYSDWKTGLDACKRFMGNNKVGCDGYDLMRSWLNIFELLCKIPEGIYPMPSEPVKPVIVFVADGGWGPWTGRDILTKGVGGSETYIIEIARWVQRSGAFQCVVFCNCEGRDTFEGVQYIPLNAYPEYIMRNKIHTAIISRYSEYIPMTYQGFVQNVYLVLHDLGPSGIVIPLNDKLKKVLCLTNWHVDHFLKSFPDFKGRTEAFYYGIDREKFRGDVAAKEGKIKNSFIYSSFPNRGLLPLLQMWPAIKRAIPDATLNVYSDINGKWVNEVAKDQMNEIRKILGGGQLDGVTMHGWVSKADLAAAWQRAEIWLYPCIFQETFCLTALEAAATKTLAIGTPLAALGETIGDRGILIDGNPMTVDWQSKALKDILDVLGDSERREKLIEQNYEWACKMSWKARGEEFARLYLGFTHVMQQQEATNDESGLNLAEMKNWVHDLPSGRGHKARFLEALAKVNPKRILEIGTFAGTSLIEMLRLYPDAKGVAVDRWTNYDETDAELLSVMEENNIEHIFYENILKADMSHRVTALKGDSVDMLLRLHQNGNKFDFIYVDGSHKCLDCYTDMVLAWGLLEKGGVLAVDDVLYHYDRVFAGEVLEYPLRGKEHFMEKYKGSYEVLSDSYRLFLVKL
jgi:predicted O-methyltransferase YrrM